VGDDHTDVRRCHARIGQGGLDRTRGTVAVLAQCQQAFAFRSVAAAQVLAERPRAPRQRGGVAFEHQRARAFAKQTAVATRIEDYAPTAPFDVVISRAFADLRTFAESSARHVADHGVLVAMKGVHPDEELADLPADIVVIATHALAVPGLDAARHLIVMQRQGTRA